MKCILYAFFWVDICEKDPCENGGTCFQNGNAYFCQCSSQFDGKNCEIQNIIPENSIVKSILLGPFCSQNPCKNGSSCYENEDTYYCSCRDGFDGYNCEKSKFSFQFLGTHFFLSYCYRVAPFIL